MELPHRAVARLAALALALLACVVLPSAAVAAELERPKSETEPPRFFERSAREVERIASGADKVRDARRDGPLRPTAYTKGAGRWQVSFFRDKDEVVQVQVDDRSGAVLEQWSGDQVAWTMARGYAGAFGRKLNAPYVWIPLCLLFLVPFVDLRRPFRLLHLDLLVLLAFGASHFFFNRGEIGVSAPLVYPVLLYLLGRVLYAAFRPRRAAGPLVPHLPLMALVVGLVFLTAFRIGLNVADSNVIDVGYSGVVGADRIVDGDPLYGKGFAPDNEHGDTYGPAAYLAYVPFEQGLPWSGRWDDLPAAHGAAIAFDLLTLLVLYGLGRRLRAGPEGHALGAALAYAWAACPYTAFVLESNANDSLVALLVALGLLAAAPAARGAAVALGAAAKFAPLALAPLLAGVDRRGRSIAIFSVVLLAVLAATVLPFVPDGGLRQLYDRTVGYQAGRPSPFSIWGQEPSLDWLQTGVKVCALALAFVVAFVPKRKDARQVAALAAAVLIAVQLGVNHWFFLYVVWFLPPLLVATLGAYREPGPTGPGPEPGAARSRLPGHPGPPLPARR